MLNIIVPMSGRGSRFADAGYPQIKPLIPVNGTPMIERVVRNIGLVGQYIFIIQESHESQLRPVLEALVPNSIIIALNRMTRGAAESILAAKPYINSGEPLLTANCDQLVNWNPKEFMKTAMLPGIDGVIQTIHTTDPSFSFVRMGESGFVSEVAEKRPISDIGTTGLYFWKYGSDFVKYASKMIADNTMELGEFYMAPVYNLAIVDWKNIAISMISEMHNIGTPHHLNEYYAKTSFI